MEDPFYLKQELNRLNQELFKYRLQSGHSTRYTKDIDYSRSMVRELESKILVIETKLSCLK